MVAWQLFAQVTGGATPLFESWASDRDTFRPGATFPTGDEAKNGLDLRPAVLPNVSGAAPGGNTLAAHGKGATTDTPATAGGTKSGAAPAGASGQTAASGQPAATPAAGNACSPTAPPLTGVNAEPGNVQPNGPAEEVRRNRPAFDYIVGTNTGQPLNSIKTLQAAFAKNVTVDFPVDSIEVKTNWIPVSCIATFYPTVASQQIALKDRFYITNDANGVPHALLSMHLISKQVPNWTWATFEHQDNPGRCDWIGCRDTFGATTPFVPPVDNQGQNQGTLYGACPKTEALGKILSGGNVAGVFRNYCLKGSQTDFTDNTGLPIRLGNSVIEFGFVNGSSCMTCHGTAGFKADGTPASPVNTVIGTIPYNLFWSGTPAPPKAYVGTPNYYQGVPGLTRLAASADFVWSIPFCAYDDTKTPAVLNSNCQNTGR